MSQASNYSIANATGAAVRSDLNDVFSAIVSQNSGTIEPVPSPTGTNPASYAYMLWADTATTKLKMRNGANSAWIEVGTLDQTGLNIVASKFPNVTTNVTLTSAQLNDAVYLPSGVKMVFFEQSAPVGWIQDTSHNDKALRIVSGAGAGSGGTESFSNLNHSHTGSSGATVAPTQAHTHTVEDIFDIESYVRNDNDPARNVRNLGLDGTGTGGGLDTNNEYAHYVTQTTSSTGGSAGHSHTVAVNSGNISPKYIDVIVCTKS